MNVFSVVTPCYNAERMIEETLSSVINQTALKNGRVQLEYILCDGGSTDQTVALAESMLKGVVNCTYHIISEQDNGMYDALVKGLRMATGNFCSYINAGDYYSPYSFDILDHIFRSPGIQWVTGIRMLMNESSQITGVRLPFKYRRSFIRKGYYGSILPFIQQESTFWKRELNNMIDLDYLGSLKFAGDYYLWTRFATGAELYIAEAYLGAFKIHSGQKSENFTAYEAEKKQFAKTNLPGILVDLPMIAYEWLYFFADYHKSKANSKTMITYNHKNGQWQIPV
jgi:glycosyltransferase involved in cell wall biosynthesis